MGKVFITLEQNGLRSRAQFLDLHYRASRFVICLNLVLIRAGVRPYGWLKMEFVSYALKE